MPRTGIFPTGGIKHRPLWQRLFIVIVGLLIIFSGFLFAFPEPFLAQGFPVQGLVLLKPFIPFWFRLIGGFMLLLVGGMVGVWGMLA